MINNLGENFESVFNFIDVETLGRTANSLNYEIRIKMLMSLTTSPDNMLHERDLHFDIMLILLHLLFHLSLTTELNS